MKKNILKKFSLYRIRNKDHFSFITFVTNLFLGVLHSDPICDDGFCQGKYIYGMKGKNQMWENSKYIDNLMRRKTI